ncbi:MAG: hypothetical protein WAK93_09715 [Solirubrobacteraceae bacterium]
MTALWRNDGTGWGLLTAAGFPDEAALHGLVENAPQLLPLSGAPQLVIVGREVSLGDGFADLIAVEPSGRMAVIEVKLARNSEARRAVVAQVLTYAAFLHGMDVATLELDVLGRQLRDRGYDSLAGAIAANDQEGSLDTEEFGTALAANLASGAFRLVLVLDDAPSELTRLVGYLEAIGDQLVIDLVTVTAYEVDGTQIMVPQRVDPERVRAEPDRPAAGAKASIVPTTAGASEFLAFMETAPPELQVKVKRLADWAISLEQERLVRLLTGHGKGRMTLLPRLYGDDAGLVTIWTDGGVSLWRTVFERRAADEIPAVEAALGTRIGTGNTVRELSNEALQALSQAYRSAARAITQSRT